MSKYTSHKACVDRLLKEYYDHGKIIVAFDFDGTVCDYNHENPQPTLERPAYEEICQLIRDLAPYSYLIGWSCRCNGETDWEDSGAQDLAEQWLKNHNVPYDAFNEDGVVNYGGRKIYANIFLDDRAGMGATVEILKDFLVQVDPIFDAISARNQIVRDIRIYFERNCSTTPKAIIGMSGGADSTIVAALCAEAIGAKRVHGFILPNGKQYDYDEALEICQILGINHYTVNIEDQVNLVKRDLIGNPEINPYIKNNLPALVRRNYLTAQAMMMGARMINTTNATEEFLGYITKGDNTAGDFAPILNYTKTEVQKIGLTYTHFPEYYVTKVPADGMCGETDEERFGFTYKEADGIIRQTNKPILVSKATKIVLMNRQSEFKRKPLARAKYIDKAD